MKNTEISTAAAALGRKGGAAKSVAKTITARANGVSGGRPRTRFELVFSGSAMASYFPRYRRHHDSLESARATAESVRSNLDFRVLGAHHGIVYGPGCGPSGTAI